jgi:TRAP-type mannitol/chloroaromatic compound transport system permease small subunit
MVPLLQAAAIRSKPPATGAAMPALLAYASAVERLLGLVGRIAGWLFILNVVVICVDVITRKFGFQIPGLGSTRLQELEWHFHMALFMLWLGLVYLRNGHVRIDVVVGRLSPRTTAWIELIGLLLFALPYCLVLLNYGADFAWKAWISAEGSESATGLPWRWIPKSIMELGLFLLLLAVTAMLARVVVFLFGPEALRDRARPPNIRA